MLATNDIWTLGTYRRLDVLDVPAFGSAGASPVKETPRGVRSVEMRRLPTDLPSECAGVDDWLASQRTGERVSLGALTRLSVLLRYLASPLRYEPFNLYGVHRAVPSARCLYPLSYHVILPTPHGVEAWVYLPEHHALEQITPPGMVTPETPATIVGVARIWTIAGKYGDFSPFPAILEAGMAAAQVFHLANVLDCSPQWADRNCGRPFCQNPWELPVFAIGLDRVTIQTDALPRTRSRVAELLPDPTLPSRFPQLAALLAAFDEGVHSAAVNVADSPAPILPPGDDRGLLWLMRRRHSSNDREGLAPLLVQVAPSFLDDLIAGWRTTSASRPALPGEESLILRVVWISASGPRSGLYCAATGACLTPDMERHAVVSTLTASLPFEGFRYNMSALTCVAMICVKPDAIAGDGANPRDIHMAAGAAAQDFCLAATGFDLFARPVRMLKEEVLELGFPLGGRLIYQLLCGFSRINNPILEML